MADDLAALRPLAELVLGDSTFAETLDRVNDLALTVVTGADMVGITVVSEGRARTAVFSDPTAHEIDQAQYDSGEGPCLEAFETQRVTTIESTTEPGKWPEFRRVAAEHGVLSTFSVPLAVGENRLGAMNFYARRERAFDDDAVAGAYTFARQAAVVLGNAQSFYLAQDLNERLADAMEARSVIEQAKGILMGSQGCDADTAFELLVQASQRENTKLRDIAQRIVADTVARGRAKSTENES